LPQTGTLAPVFRRSSAIFANYAAKLGALFLFLDEKLESTPPRSASEKRWKFIFDEQNFASIPGLFPGNARQGVMPGRLLVEPAEKRDCGRVQDATEENTPRTCSPD
jgi:hypothetical protein